MKKAVILGLTGALALGAASCHVQEKKDLQEVAEIAYYDRFDYKEHLYALPNSSDIIIGSPQQWYRDRVFKVGRKLLYYDVAMSLMINADGEEPYKVGFWDAKGNLKLDLVSVNGIQLDPKDFQKQYEEIVQKSTEKILSAYRKETAKQQAVANKQIDAAEKVKKHF